MPITPAAGFNFAFCVPSRGMVGLEWATRFRDIAIPMNCSGFMNTTVDREGGEVAESRNALVSEALRRGASHLFWIDDDVCLTRFALVSLFKQMKDDPSREIVSGVYFTKHEISEPLIYPAPGAATSPFMAEGTCEAWAHGMGVALVTANLYRRMAKELELPKDKYGRVEFYKTRGPEEPIEEIGCVNMGCTEDFHFLKLAAKLGVKPLIDMSKWAFGWHVDPKTGKGYPEQQYKQMAEEGRVVWNTPKGKVVWE